MLPPQDKTHNRTTRLGPEYSPPPRQFIHARQNFLDAHLLPAMECVRSIAPGTSEVAPRQTHEYARQARACAFALNRLEDFRDDHFGVRRHAAAFPAAPHPRPWRSRPGWNSLCDLSGATTSKSFRRKESWPQ